MRDALPAARDPDNYIIMIMLMIMRIVIAIIVIVRKVVATIVDKRERPGLQHDPDAEHDEAAYEERRLPLQLSRRAKRRHLLRRHSRGWARQKMG